MKLDFFIYHSSCILIKEILKNEHWMHATSHDKIFFFTGNKYCVGTQIILTRKKKISYCQVLLDVKIIIHTHLCFRSFIPAFPHEIPCNKNVLFLIVQLVPKLHGSRLCKRVGAKVKITIIYSFHRNCHPSGIVELIRHG